MANPQYVYHMHKLSKAYPGGKQVLKDINLSFFPGAKIGVVGLNGSGKSTLLKIMAGQLDTEFTGEAWVGRRAPRSATFQPGARSSTPALNVLGNVDGPGVKPKRRRIVDRYNELMMPTIPTRRPTRWRPPCRIEIDAREPLGSRGAGGTVAMEALGCPPGDAEVGRQAVGRRAPPRRALTRLLLSEARPAAARRADQPSRCRDHVSPGSKSFLQANTPAAVLIITHDRYFLDTMSPAGFSSSTAGRGVPYEGQLFTPYLDQPSAKRFEQVEKGQEESTARQKVLDARARMDGLRAPQGTAVQVQGPPQGL